MCIRDRYMGDVFTLLHEHGLVGHLTQEDAMRELLGRVIDLVKSGRATETPLFCAVVFAFFNTAAETLGFEALSEHLGVIEALVRRTLVSAPTPVRGDTFALVNMMAFLRRTFLFLEVFPKDFEKTIVNDVLRVGAARLEAVRRINPETTPPDLVDQFTELFATEFGETISRVSLCPQTSVDETLLYSLLRAPFPTVQKATFFLLKHLYNVRCLFTGVEVPKGSLASKEASAVLQEGRCLPLDVIQFLENFEPGRAHDGSPTLEDEEIIGEDADADDEAEALCTTENLGYVITMAALLCKLKTPITSNADFEVCRQGLDLYITSTREVSYGFLQTCFRWVKAMRLSESEMRETVKNEDVTEVSPEALESLSKESFFKLLVQTVYLFATRFPVLLRRWCEETDKGTEKNARFVVSQFISAALFGYEIRLIEEKQEEWRSEDFSIYCVRNTREIIAEFLKEGARVGIGLKVPANYPLSVIELSELKEVKMDAVKMKKWLLRMQTLLNRENQSILAALLLWRGNVEKEFEGLEECAICYYIINSGKELPRKACRTCRKKFHTSCIQKWFSSSNKSECPLCKSSFL
eukprot:TRINITY_DN4590_c0_g1_i5.p1 TRINITY_DN4590_c0_g1~~TRINITY_DN4590_c0_g1_i5.p1  ORF type:complete len:582 (+),score=147.75 TRINITY_DN4590_c0_g1_i5:64-1809(+)